MNPLLVALGFLTRLPVPALVVSDADFARAIRCYPVVGLILGAMISGAYWSGGWIDPWVAALAGLAAWVGLTGGLHLDGLADLADGCGAAHRDRARLLAVMADPHIGSFGTIAIAFQLVAKLVLLHALAGEPVWLVALVPFAARIAPLGWARALPPLKPGLGTAIGGATRLRDLLGWGALLAAAACLAPALLAMPVLAAGYGWWLHRRLGGITGDCHGAGIEVLETGLLLALAIGAG